MHPAKEANAFFFDNAIEKAIPNGEKIEAILAAVRTKPEKK